MADIIKTAQDNYKRDKDAWAENYRKGKEDVAFLSDDEYAQWDERDAENRRKTGRPAITIDQLGQFVHQVANDARMNTPTINVVPGDNEASEETADIYKGLVKKIEYHSGADSAYDTAITCAIKGAIGFIRVDHDYSDDKTDLQELYIKRVPNPFACMIDSSSIEVDGSDAMHGFVLETITIDKFKSRFKGKDPVSFESDDVSDDDCVTICEYFEIEESDNGAVGKRALKKRTVRRYVLSGKDVLEETTFPGKYIPIVPVYGEESWIGGKRCLSSLIRKSKEAQKMFNYWKSLETEVLMKQPQSPWIAPAGSVEDYADDWRNPERSMVLRYNQEKDGKRLDRPERIPPPLMPAGIINASREAVDDIKATMGIYNASLGAKSNETSGVAINQRKLEGDVATYHFGDNLLKSIAHVGKILVCAIPEVYDSKRIIRIIGEDNESKPIGINGALVDGQERMFSLSEGMYDVRVVTGAPFTTKRQEAAAALQEMFARVPSLMEVMGDLYFKNSDFAGSQAMAERMEKIIDPKFLEEDDAAVDQEKIQMQQALEAAKVQIQQLAEQLKSKTDNEQLKANIEVAKYQSELEMTKMESAVKMAEIQVKEQELSIKAQENDLKMLEIRARLASLPAEIEQSSSMQ